MSPFDWIVLVLCIANITVTLAGHGILFRGQLMIFEFMNKHLKNDIACTQARIEEWVVPK